MTGVHHSEACVPAYPLGRPAGINRHSMTPELAVIYRIVADHFDAHGAMPSLSHIGREFGTGRSCVHEMMSGLVERGWLVRYQTRNQNRYSLIDPVMRFARVPQGHELLRSTGSRRGHRT